MGALQFALYFRRLRKSMEALVNGKQVSRLVSHYFNTHTLNCRRFIPGGFFLAPVRGRSCIFDSTHFGLVLPFIFHHFQPQSFPSHGLAHGTTVLEGGFPPSCTRLNLFSWLPSTAGFIWLPTLFQPYAPSTFGRRGMTTLRDWFWGFCVVFVTSRYGVITHISRGTRHPVGGQSMNLGGPNSTGTRFLFLFRSWDG